MYGGRGGGAAAGAEGRKRNVVMVVAVSMVVLCSRASLVRAPLQGRKELLRCLTLDAPWLATMMVHTPAVTPHQTV